MTPRIALVTLSAFVPILAFAQDQGRDQGQSRAPERTAFGIGRPIGPEQLPPGRMRERLESLPAPARQRALAWLQSFSFPAEDIESIEIDANGGVFYADPPPGESEGAVDDGAPTFEAVEPAEVFRLHSKPGAANTVFVDVDGHVIEGTAWRDGARLDAAPLDLDGQPGFSDAELDAIATVWHRVAEDLSPFDIDVTTEQPAAFGPNVGRLLITRSTDLNGTPMPSSASGGVAYVNVWGRSDFAYYSPALAYYDNVGGSRHNMSEVSSHEIGHNLGLSHDGTSTTGYYGGRGTGLIDWAPIMGNSYYAELTQWSRGEYPDANNTQDDLAIIGGKLGGRGDDHANTLADATALVVGADGSVQSTDPESDPANFAGANKGVVDGTGDVDVFRFESGGGPLELRVLPAWTAFPNVSRRGANLDVGLRLLDAAGETVASADPPDDTEATLSLSNLPAGTHYLAITGVGNANVSSYASLGQYFVRGAITPAGDAPNSPPSVPDGFAVADGTDGSALLTWSPDAGAERIEIARQKRHRSGNRWVGDARLEAPPGGVYGDAVGSGTFRYRVRAVNASGASDWTAWIEVRVTGGGGTGRKK